MTSNTTAYDCFQRFGKPNINVKVNVNTTTNTSPQLLHHIKTIPTNIPLVDGHLPAGGVERGSALEIWGDSGSGKTAFLVDMCADWLLSGIGVAYVDVDLKLPVDRLTRIIDERLAFTPSLVAELNDYLGNMQVFRCDNTLELIATLHYLVEYLSMNRHIGVVVIDSVTPYYWFDKLEADDGVNPLVYLLTAAQAILRMPDPPAVFIARTHVLPDQDGEKVDPLGKDWSRFARNRIFITKSTPLNPGTLRVNRGGEKHTFQVTDARIEFLS